MTNKPTWEIEFDEKFGHSMSEGMFFHCSGDCDTDSRVIKQFISTKLEEQRKEIAEEIEKEKQLFKVFPTMEFRDGYDSGLQTAINLIKQ